MTEKSLLAQKIEEAQTEMNCWPEWMKATSKFEGASRDSEEYRVERQDSAAEQTENLNKQKS